MLIMNLVQMKVNQFKHHQKKHEQVQIKKHPNHPVKNMYENYDQENKKEKKWWKYLYMLNISLFLLRYYFIVKVNSMTNLFVCMSLFIEVYIHSYLMLLARYIYIYVHFLSMNRFLLFFSSSSSLFCLCVIWKI